MDEVRNHVNTEDLNLDPSKPTVLVVSDSAAIHSGFAQVVRNVFGNLWPDRPCNIVQYGWWHSQPMERVPWPIVTTNRMQNNPVAVDPADKYGELSFEDVVGSIKP